MLIIGYGNPGRGDDGLGPAFAERIAAEDLPGVTVESAYQLTVEHALQLSSAQHVVFADAVIGGTAPFELLPVVPAPGDLGSHSLTPPALLQLTLTLYGTAPPAHVMAIAGQDFGQMHEGLGKAATANLDAAIRGFLDWFARSDAWAAPTATQGTAHA